MSFKAFLLWETHPPPPPPSASLVFFGLPALLDARLSVCLSLHPLPLSRPCWPDCPTARLALSVCPSTPLPLSRPCWAVFPLHACLCLSVCLSLRPPSPCLVLVGLSALQHACLCLCLCLSVPPSPYLVLGQSALLLARFCLSVCPSTPIPLSHPCWPDCPPSLSVCPFAPHPLILFFACLPSCMPVSVCLSLRAPATPLSRPCWPAALQIPVSVCLSVPPTPSPCLILVGMSALLPVCPSTHLRLSRPCLSTTNAQTEVLTDDKPELCKGSVF